MIHVLFNENDAERLREAMALDSSLEGEVVSINDDYSVGPLDNIYQAEGMEVRTKWWQSVWEGSDFERNPDDPIQDAETVKWIADKLKSDDTCELWIWAAQNNHDVCGYFWLLPYLREYTGRVMILYLNNLPFINEKGNIFYPLKLSEIPAKEFLKARKLARPVTTSEFEVDTDEWLKITMENKGVRLLEGGKKLAQHDYSYYDNELKRFIMPDWQKAGKIIHHFQSKAKHTTGEAYLLWRLKVMIAMDQFDVQGKLANMKDFEIKYRAKAEA